MLPLQDHEIDIQRFIILLAPFLWTGFVIMLLKPSKRMLVGAFIAVLWNLAMLIPLNILANLAGWWTFNIDEMLFMSLPIDVVTGWSVFWGSTILLLFNCKDFLLGVLFVFCIDLIVMPELTPLVTLGEYWLYGELLVLIVSFIPGWFIASSTAEDRFVNWRSAAQAIITAILILVCLPAALLEQYNRTFFEILNWSQIRLMMFFNIIAFLIILGLSGNQEFAQRGNGTPIPLDPPKKLVITGPYAYLGNPMQLSVVLCLTIMSIFYESIMIFSAAVMAVIYCLGIVSAHHQIDLQPRFGKSWLEYRKQVPYWFPRWKPWIKKPSIIYFARDCNICTDTEKWLRNQKPIGLKFVDAKTHELRLERVTYRYPDGSEESGIYAISSALSHINFALAFFGWFMRLPVICQLIQLLVDITGERATQCQQPKRDKS